jgi:cellulose synthase operon protein C
MDKTLNRKLLLGVAAGLAAFVLVVWAVHRVQVGRHARHFLDEAARAEEDGAYDRAADALRRYLALRPDDADALGRYGRALEHLADPGRNRPRALAAYEQALARDPSRADLRRRAAELSLELGDPAAARRHAEILLKYYPPEDDLTEVAAGPWYRPRLRTVAAAPDADRGELKFLLGRCFEADGRDVEAEAAYEAAAAHAPGCVGAYARLAALRRRLGRPERGEDALHDLVEANPGVAEAYLQRALFRLADGRFDAAQDDLDEARAVNPDDPRVLRTDAELAARRGDLPLARSRWEFAVTRHPDDLAARVGLVGTEVRLGKAEALADCDRALERFPDHPELLHLRVEALLLRGDADAAGRVIGRLDDRAPYGLAEYLAARADMARGRWGEAARRLEDALAMADLAPELEWRACLNAGICHGRLGNPDRQVAYFYRAAALEPDLPETRLGLGAALQALGRTDEALEQLRPLARLPAPPEALWPVLARALVQANLALPQGRRRDADALRVWDEADDALRRAAASADPEVRAAGALARADWLTAQGKPAAAVRSALAEARTREPRRLDLWLAEARRLAWDGDAAAGLRLLDEAESAAGDGAELRLLRLQLWDGRPDHAALLVPALALRGDLLARTERGLETFTPEEQARLLGQLALTADRLRRPADAARLRQRRNALEPDDLPAAVVLLDYALLDGDDAAIARARDRLRRLEGEDGTWHRYAEAARLAVRAAGGDRSALSAARAVLADLRPRRPTWPRADWLAGHLDELEGSPEKAAADYRRAFDLGERHPALVLSLVRVLVGLGRHEDADQVLTLAERQLEWNADLTRRAAEVALRAGNRDRAAALARRATPAAAGWAERLRLAEVLSRAGRADEAEKEY